MIGMMYCMIAERLTNPEPCLPCCMVWLSGDLQCKGKPAFGKSAVRGHGPTAPVIASVEDSSMQLFQHDDSAWRLL